MLNEIMSPHDVAESTKEGGFGVSVQRQAVLRMNNAIPFMKRGRYIRYKRSELLEWFEQGRVA